MNLKIQQCTLASLDDLVEISIETFVDAFEKDNNPEDFETYIRSAFSKETLRKELLNKDSDYYFVYSDEFLAGYFKLNQNEAQTDLKLTESLELERIYVLKEFQGKQIGRWMLKEIIEIATTLQKQFVWLGVWEKNTKAIAFYEKNGFSKFGRHPYYIGNDKQMDWLMRFDL